MAFWVYMLRCAGGRYYTGQTDMLDRRIAEHQAGGTCDFTARRRPVALVWSETFASRIEAIEAERRIRPWSRAKKEALIAGDWTRLSHFARPPAERGRALPDPAPAIVSSEVGPRRPAGIRPSTSLGTNGHGEAVAGEARAEQQ